MVLKELISLGYSENVTIEEAEVNSSNVYYMINEIQMIDGIPKTTMHAITAEQYIELLLSALAKRGWEILEYNCTSINEDISIEIKYRKHVLVKEMV